MNLGFMTCRDWEVLEQKYPGAMAHMRHVTLVRELEQLEAAEGKRELRTYEQHRLKTLREWRALDRSLI